MRRLLTISFIAMAVMLIACDGDDGDSPALSPTVGANTPAPTASAAPPPSDEIALTVGDPIPFPEDLAITITTGCWQCDGPITSLVRLRVTPVGIEERVVFDPATARGGDITGYAFDSAFGQAAISTCGPNCTGLGATTGEERTTLHVWERSTSAFEPADEFDGWISVEGYGSNTLMISGPFESGVPHPLRRYPWLEDIARPVEGFFPEPAGNAVLWLNEARTTLIAPNGSVLFASAGENISAVTALDAAGERIAILIYRPEDAQADLSGYRLFIGRRSADALQHERTLTGGFIHAGAALDECTLVANAELPAGSFPTPDTQGFFIGFLPSIIDVCEGVIHPIVDPFTQAPYLNGRNLIAAVQRGPFLAVRDDIGDCLNVRDTPSTAAASLGCFGAGALLQDLDETQVIDGQMWRRVGTPGDEGWASAEFLTP